MSNQLKNELHNIISGKSQVKFGTTIQAIACYLRIGEQSGSKVEKSKQIREQETKKLEDFLSKESLLIQSIGFSQYVSEGAQQRVYLKDSNHVLKLNDAIYYTS